MATTTPEEGGSEPEPLTASAMAGVVLSEDWFVVSSDLARAMEEQLARELLPGHWLHGCRLAAALKSNVNDDVVFYEINSSGSIGGWWSVHLTWSTPIDHRWPDFVAVHSPVAGVVWP